MGETRKTYEGMFLLDPSSDFNAACEPIRKAMDRSEVEVLTMKPWDERRLAYDIKGRKRGLYVLTYFKAEPGRLVELEHDCQLDERIVRLLVLRRDSLTDDEINAETPALTGQRRAREREEAAEAAKAAKAAEAEAAEAAEAEAAEEDTAEAAKTTETTELKDTEESKAEIAEPEKISAAADTTDADEKIADEGKAQSETE